MKNEVKRCRSCDTFSKIHWHLESWISNRKTFWLRWMFCIELRYAVHKTKLLFVFRFIFSVVDRMFLRLVLFFFYLSACSAVFILTYFTFEYLNIWKFLFYNTSIVQYRQYAWYVRCSIHVQYVNSAYHFMNWILNTNDFIDFELW